MSTEKRPGRRPTITDEEALQFHQQGKPGKLEITPTKPMATQRDLSLAYSPGVAVPVRKIAEDPATAYDYTDPANPQVHDAREDFLRPPKNENGAGNLL